MIFTVWPGDLAPDHPDLGPALLLLAPVDISDLLAEIEASHVVSTKVPNRFRLDKEGFRDTYLAALVSSTPSILIRLVLGWTVCRLRW